MSRIALVHTQSPESGDCDLIELQSLCRAVDFESVFIFYHRQKQVRPSTFISSHMVNDIAFYLKKLKQSPP